MFKSIL